MKALRQEKSVPKGPWRRARRVRELKNKDKRVPGLGNVFWFIKILFLKNQTLDFRILK